MRSEVYGINVEGLTAIDLKAWLYEVPEDYNLSFYELENEYGPGETLLLAVKPK